MNPVGFQRELGAFPEDLVGSLTKALVYSWGEQVAEVLDHIAPMCLSLHTNPGMHFDLSMALTNEVPGEIPGVPFEEMSFNRQRAPFRYYFLALWQNINISPSLISLFPIQWGVCLR